MSRENPDISGWHTRRKLRHEQSITGTFVKEMDPNVTYLYRVSKL